MFLEFVNNNYVLILNVILEIFSNNDLMVNSKIIKLASVRRVANGHRWRRWYLVVKSLIK